MYTKNLKKIWRSFVHERLFKNYFTGKLWIFLDNLFQVWKKYQNFTYKNDVRNYFILFINIISNLQDLKSLEKFNWIFLGNREKGNKKKFLCFYWNFDIMTWLKNVIELMDITTVFNMPKKKKRKKKLLRHLCTKCDVKNSMHFSYWFIRYNSRWTFKFGQNCT